MRSKRKDDCAGTKWQIMARPRRIRTSLARHGLGSVLGGNVHNVQVQIRLRGGLLVLTTRTTQSEPAATLPYGRGCMKGKICLAEDFDAPLEDFKDYME